MLVRITSTMMDIYARAGMHDPVETMSKNRQLNVVQLNIMIKSLGKADKADKATAILKTVLTNSNVNPTIETFGTLMNAWAESSRADAVDQAFAVLRLMTEDPKCIHLGLRPDTVVFNSMLKTFSNSKSKDSGKKVAEIMNEMERRYKAGDNNVNPDVISFTLAIKACLQAGDADTAQLIMDRMEKSDTPPTIRTYNDILNNWANVGTLKAAERAEQILTHLKQLAKNKNPDLKPDAFAYTIVMNAWAKSDHSESGERMWRLYEQMRENNVEPSIVTFAVLISFFAKSKEQKVFQRSEILLQCMEESKHPDIQPDHRHYVPVIKGWLNIGDVDKASRVLVRSIQAYIEKKNMEAAPNAVIIDMVMQGWIKAGDLDQATSLIAKVQELKDSNVLPEGPNSRTYNSLLRAWVRSMHPEKDVNIQKLKDRLAAHQKSASGT